MYLSKNQNYTKSVIMNLVIILLTLALYTGLRPIQAQGANAAPDVIPRLREWTGGTGNFTLSSNSRIVVDTTTGQSYKVGSVTSDILSTRTLTTVANSLKADIQTLTGLNLAVVSGGTLQNGDIFVQLDSADVGIGTEGYNLEIGDHITLKANTSTGIFYGGRTLLQVLKQDVNQRDIVKGTARDYPTQKVRLIMLDIGRKYWDKAYLKDVMRQMSWHKLNVFFMHFAEAEGFRLNSPSKFPGLADPNSSYSQAEIQELETFAQEHHISIMPGFEFPGHATIVADYFNIGFGDGANPCTNAHTHSHLTPNFVIDMTSSTAITKVNEILNEFLPWFSGPYVHVGGDEVPGQLGNCPRVTSHIGLEPDVSSLGDVLIKFINGMNTTIKAQSKQTVIFGGWDHLSSPQQNPDSDIIMMDWEGNGSDPDFVGYNKIVVGPVGDIFLTPNNYHNLYTNESKLYDNWTASTDSEILGTGLTVWADYNFWAQEEYFENLLVRPRSILADRTWNNSTTPDDVNSFYTRITTIGNSVGYVGFTQAPRVNNGEPSHHYTFESTSYPSGYHYASRPPQTLLLADTVGTLSGTSYIINNPAINSSGRVGSSFTFDNGGDGIGLGGLDIAPPWTMAVWVKRTATDSNATLLSSRQFAIKLEQFGTTSKVGITESGVGDYSFNYETPLNTWVHLTLVGSASDTKLYVNGTLNQTLSNSISLPMRSIGNVGKTLRGDLDEMKIYDEALNATQIQTLYNSYSQGHHWRFDEGSGTVAADSMSGGNDGTISGATWIAGQHSSYALKFDGVDDYVQVGANTISTNWTAAMWVKRTANTVSASLLSGSHGALKLEQWNNTYQVGITKFGIGDYSFNYTAPLQTWVHLTFVGSASDTKLYVNGALQDTLSQAIDLPLNRIGGNTNGSDPLNAEVDDIKIYSEQLSASEIQTLYNSYSSALISHWQLNSNGNDAVGSNNGTVNGGASYDTTDKKEGTASLVLDGTNDYVALGNPANLQISGNITIAAWIKADATNGLRNVVAKGYTQSPNGEIFLRINQNSYEVGSWNGSNSLTSYAGANNDIGTWVHLVGVYTGTQWLLYKNGTMVSASNGNNVAVAADWAIGSRGGTAERFFDGKIDDVRIYNYALTSAEITTLYNSF